MRYWQSVIYRPKYTTSGGARQDVHQYHVRIQHRGRREGFALQSNNKAVAAERAKTIYLKLVAEGWDAVLKELRPQSLVSESAIRTVGDLTRAALARTTLNPQTVADYCRCFRLIVSEALGIAARCGRPATKGSTHKEWLEKVEAVPLDRITPELIQRWKRDYLGRAGADPARRRKSVTSVNTVLRNARGLFSRKLTRFMEFEPGFKPPFDGTLFEPRQSMKYHSEINLEDLVHWALHGNPATGLPALPREEAKVFFLASFAGLRRNEIDKLQWPAFRWNESVLRITATPFFSPKTEESLADVPIDAEVIALFRGWHAGRAGDFVVESALAPRNGCHYSHYRCEPVFKELVAWLRRCGITSSMPLHVLRKEYGSQICRRFGVFVASRALRHADIHITSQHYLDQRQKFTPGLGFMLKEGQQQPAVA